MTIVGNPESLLNWLAHHDIPELPGKLAVGWSGGADSTALLLALKQAGFQVQAWHVDHAWRHSSQVEMLQLKSLAASWDIPFYSMRLDRLPSVNVEAQARKARYACFTQWSSQLEVDTVCLGHQADDQAETVCMRMLQGAGAGGCQGMARERFDGDLRIVRPLLHVSGLQLRETLNEAGVSWFEDPSNRDVRLWRNKIRHQLFPAMEAVGVTPESLFLRWQKQAVRLADRLDEAADSVFSQAGRMDIIPWTLWSDSLPSVRARLLQKMMVALLGEGITPGRRHILLVEEWTSRHGRGGLDLSRCRLQRTGGSLQLKPILSDSAHEL